QIESYRDKHIFITTNRKLLRQTHFYCDKWKVIATKTHLPKLNRIRRSLFRRCASGVRPNSQTPSESRKEIPIMTTTPKISPIRAVMGFNAMTANDLLAFALGVLKALTGNASFTNPTVSLTVFGNDITVYSNALAAALDGGKNAKTESK